MTYFMRDNKNMQVCYLRIAFLTHVKAIEADETEIVAFSIEIELKCLFKAYLWVFQSKSLYSYRKLCRPWLIHNSKIFETTPNRWSGYFSLSRCKLSLDLCPPLPVFCRRFIRIALPARAFNEVQRSTFVWFVFRHYHGLNFWLWDNIYEGSVCIKWEIKYMFVFNTFIIFFCTKKGVKSYEE